MATPVDILVIGRHAQIMETVLRLINNEPMWSAKGALTDEDAIRLFEEQGFDLVLVGGGVDDASVEKLATHFKKQKPEVKIVQHFGGGSGLLFNEIQQALSH